MSVLKIEAASDQQKIKKKHRQLRKKRHGRDDLKSIGKRMRRTTKATQGIRNPTTLSVLKPNGNNDTNIPLITLSGETKKWQKVNAMDMLTCHVHALHHL